MKPHFQIFMPSALLCSFGRFSFAQAQFCRTWPNSLPGQLMVFFTSSEVKRLVIAAVMGIFVRFSTLSQIPATKTGSATSDAVFSSNPATVARDLGIQVQGILEDEEGVDPSNRFEIVFYLGVFLVEALLVVTSLYRWRYSTQALLLAPCF